MISTTKEPKERSKLVEQAWALSQRTGLPFQTALDIASGKIVLKYVTIPADKGWNCATCGRTIKPGETALRAGRLVLCAECARKAVAQ